MGERWPAGGRRQPGTGPIPVVFYRATVGVAIERSVVSFNEQVDPARVEAALTAPLPYARGPWPPESRRPSTRLLLLTLARFKAFFDRVAPAQDTAPSAREMAADIPRRFPWVKQDLLGDAATYKRFEVEASILDNGQVTWGYRTPAEGSYPPGLRETGLEPFLQAVVRADLQRRLEALSG